MTTRSAQALAALVLANTAAGLAGCSTPAPATLQVPQNVLIPTYSCPVANVHPEPVLARPASRAPADVVRSALTQIEQLKADNVALRALLNPYTEQSQNKFSDGTK